MILAVDVAYFGSEAVAAGVTFDDWQDEAPEREVVTRMEVPAAYQPGQFYKRELPCILELLREHDLQPDCLIVDGFVDLNGEGRPGLGRHLYEVLGGKVPVIGVAKSPFRGTRVECQVRRGNSTRPLYVTVAGADLEQAKEWIRTMHGRYRLPTLLKRVDGVCRRSCRESGGQF